MVTNSNKTSDPQVRDIRALDPTSYTADFDRWAVIIGISSYDDKRIPALSYADRDAEELYELLQTPSGGGFEKDHILKLTNENATTRSITKALRGFLRTPAREDLVLIYFACHGDIDGKNIFYLLTYDTEFKDIPGTAVPMREINQSLRDYVLSEHVVVIADTCHSGALGEAGGRNAGNRADALNTYLKEVSQARPGVAILTSAEAGEVSFENEMWDKHGVFTYFLLKGLRGEADGYSQASDGKVTVGELFDYIYDNVKEETKNRQHPWRGSDYDRNLVLAVTGGITAQEHFQLGCLLYELGWILDDPRRFQSAIGQYKEALRLSSLAGIKFPEANFSLGKGLLASGDPESSIKVLTKAIDESNGRGLDDALCCLGTAFAKQLKTNLAVGTFERFLRDYPDHENAGWVGKYVDWLKRLHQVRKYALLIGNGKYLIGSNLEGPGNDVRLLKEVLVSRYGFDEENIITLLDEAATRAGIINALEFLIRQTTPTDVVVIFRSGHVTYNSAKDENTINDLYITYDTKSDKKGFNTLIKGHELNNLIVRIPANHKVVLLDAGGSQIFDLAQKTNEYNLFVAASPGEYAVESSVVHQGKTIFVGNFIYNFIQILETIEPEKVTYGKLIDLLVEKMSSNRDSFSAQTPRFLGDKEHLAFRGDAPWHELIDLAQKVSYPSISSMEISFKYKRCMKQITSLPPKVHYNFARAFMEKQDYQKAITALNRAIEQNKRYYPEATLSLASAQLCRGDYDEAQKNFNKYLSFAPNDPQSLKIQSLLLLSEKLSRQRKYALLIGINEYIDPEIPKIYGAINDVLALKEILLKMYGFEETNIKVLINGDATRGAIVTAFKEIVEKSFEEPAFFYFSGCGSFGSNPAVVPADARNYSLDTDITREDVRSDSFADIELKELADIVGNNDNNLVTIIDAGWRYMGKSKERNRFITRPAQLNLNAEADLGITPPRIGYLSIYQGSIRRDAPISARKIEKQFTSLDSGKGRKVYGRLTFSLIQVLKEAGANSLTYDQLIKAISQKLEDMPPYIDGKYYNQKILGNTLLGTEVNGLIDKILKKPIADTIQILQRLIDQRKGLYPEGYLELGIAYAALGDSERSIASLEKSLSQGDLPEAHYHLGRVLFEDNRDLARSVSELRSAIKLDPANIRSHYYLGQAIRLLVERETLLEAEKAFQVYLDGGAPLGHKDDVKQFLSSRRK